MKFKHFNGFQHLKSSKYSAIQITPYSKELAVIHIILKGTG